MCRLFHKKVKVNISDIKELVIGESYIYSRYGRIYLNTVYVENGKKKDKVPMGKYSNDTEGRKFE